MVALPLGSGESSNVTYGALPSGPRQIVLQTFDHTVTRVRGGPGLRG